MGEACMLATREGGGRANVTIIERPWAPMQPGSRARARR